jgi:hypothetical protein
MITMTDAKTTIAASFAPTIKLDPNTTEKYDSFQHICSMPEFQKFSCEVGLPGVRTLGYLGFVCDFLGLTISKELRLADYELGYRVAPVLWG